MTVITYVWVNEMNLFETKSYEYSFIPSSLQYAYKWNLPNDRFLVPTYMCDDPFHHTHILLFCDMYHTAGDAYILSPNNSRQAFLQFINFDENSEIIQGHDMNLHNTIYNEHARLCYLADIDITPSEDSYRFSTFNKIYEKVWITRFILQTLCESYSMCVNFTDLTYRHMGTPVSNESSSNEKSLDNMLLNLSI